MTPTNAVILVPTTNEAGKKDVTGGFAPEAKRYADILRKQGCNVIEVAIDNTQPIAKRRAQSLAALKEASSTSPLNLIACFCHGWRDGVQVGFTRKTLSELSSLPLTSDVLVALYCCSTGEDAGKRDVGAPGVGDGSFADTLRDALCAAGKVNCRVVAHTTVGHTTRNPNALFFDGLGSSVGGTGGLAPVTPKHGLWKTWRARLWGDTDFRFRFPQMSIAEIHAALLKPA